MELRTGEILKALADETRLRIVSLLLESGSLCACEIEEILQVNQSNASRHLTRLRQTGLLAATRSGTWVHFDIASDQGSDAHWKLVRHTIFLAREENDVLRNDQAHLAEYRRSGKSCRTISTGRKRTTRSVGKGYILTK